MTLIESYYYACEAGCATHLGIDHPNGSYEDRIQGDRKGTTSFGGGRNEKVVDFECSPHPPSTRGRVTYVLLWRTLGNRVPSGISFSSPSLRSGDFRFRTYLPIVGPLLWVEFNLSSPSQGSGGPIGTTGYKIYKRFPTGTDC